jgi:hypothetical protein
MIIEAIVVAKAWNVSLPDIVMANTATLMEIN